MALQSPSGSYYEWDAACNARALVVFRVLEHCPEKQLVSKKTGRVNTATPVRVDFLILKSEQNPAMEKTLVRGEEVLGRGLTNSLRRVKVGNDGVFRMEWGQGDNGPYPQANAVSGEDMEFATAVFQKTGDDPYSAVERAGQPSTLVSPAPQSAPPVAAPVAVAPAAPAQPPAADAPAPWGQGGNTGGNAPAPVGGPQGPGWGESPAATNAQPVASGSVW